MKNKTPTVLAVIPARGGSKGVPRKNIRDLGGRPLLAYVFAAASRARSLTRIILSTDDVEIAENAKSFGVEVPFLRPDELAGDRVLLPAVAKHARDFFADRGERFDAVMTIQPTCPFLKTKTIDDAVQLWVDTGCDSVTTVGEVSKGHPHVLKTLDDDGRIAPLVQISLEERKGPRQVRPKAYYLTGGLYLRDSKLFDSGPIVPHFLGDDPRALAVDEVEAVDINTPLDFDFASFLVETGRIK